MSVCPPRAVDATRDEWALLDELGLRTVDPGLRPDAAPAGPAAFDSWLQR
jgi:hypothetical protein